MNQRPDEWDDESMGRTDFDDWLSSLDGPTLHPNQLDPLPDIDAPLLATWFDEHIAEMVTAQQAELDGASAALWRQYDHMLGEIARLRDRLHDPHEHDKEREMRGWIQGAEQVFSAFRRSPQFQAALRHRLSAMEPIWERIEAREGNDPKQIIIRQRAHQQRSNLKSLLYDEPTSSVTEVAPTLEQSEQETEGIESPPTEPAPPAQEARPLVSSGAPEPVSTEAQRPEVRDRAVTDFATTKQICEAFPPPRSVKSENWESGRFLSDCPVWLKSARESNGKRGVSALWNPAQFAACMVRNGDTGKGQAASIIRRSFPAWLDVWEEKAALLD